MKVLFDTNVVLDVLLDRLQFSEIASQLFAAVEHGRMNGFLCATTLTTVHYLATKTIGITRANAEIRKLLKLFQVAPVDKFVLDQAVETGFSDFEDAVLYESAHHAGVDAIVTRNTNDFKTAKLPVYTPHALLVLTNQHNTNVT